MQFNLLPILKNQKNYTADQRYVTSVHHKMSKSRLSGKIQTLGILCISERWIGVHRKSLQLCSKSPCIIDLPVTTSVRSQGGAKFPTGGIWIYPMSPRAALLKGVSRSGEMPEPTVIVRMKESDG
jgi:hypothetical protein